MKTIKIVLMFLGLVVFTFPVKAQESAVGGAVASAFWDRVHIGVKGGVTATNVNVDVKDANLDDFDIPTAEKINWRAGIDAKVDLFDAFFLKTGLEYVNKGFNVDVDKFKEKYNDIKSLSGNWTALYQYLEMPLNFGYDLGGFELLAGPYFSYALGGKEIINLDGEMNNGNPINVDQTSDLHPVSGGSVDEALGNDISAIVPDYFKSFDFGITLGLGFRFNKFNINVQYEQGLTNITPDFSQEPNFNPDDLSLKHNVLSVNVTYWIK